MPEIDTEKLANDMRRERGNGREHAIANGLIDAIVNPAPFGPWAGLSDAGRLHAIREVLDVLTEVTTADYI